MTGNGKAGGLGGGRRPRPHRASKAKAAPQAAVPKRDGRQAVVIVHGMGEQRPLDALTGFVQAGLPPGADGRRTYYSRADIVTDSFESRRFVAPAEGNRPQTDFFEYHWAHLMQGNRFGDMWPIFKKLLVRLPWRVPNGLRFVWALFWAIIAGALTWWFVADPADISTLTSLVAGVAGAGALAAVLTFALGRLGAIVPNMVTTSFVDVVRYLDTSPRSYAVRRDIRKGFVEMLTRLHEARYAGKRRYERIVIVAHSLGAYIAYDGICYLWGRMNNQSGEHAVGEPAGLTAFDQAASVLTTDASAGICDPEHVRTYRRTQRELWYGQRAHGSNWRISDFVSVGTPMYFADILYTGNREKFRQRVGRGEIPTCPPLRSPGKHPFTYRWHDSRVLNDAAPFAVVRWTNLWFPVWPRWFGTLGDWFGGPLTPLFGSGILDVPILGNKPWRLMIASPHTLYFKQPDRNAVGDAAWHLERALALDDFAVPATDEQVAEAKALLRGLDDREGGMGARIERFTDPKLPPVTGSAEDWLATRTRAQMSTLIDQLAAMQPVRPPPRRRRFAWLRPGSRRRRADRAGDRIRDGAPEERRREAAC
ncbi:hypothetical protein [Yinghuangia soli]|uniref:Uncharacterized protein n=1 Tax=Yinghuangia soli TaxID=2908204 RepID=A0AA41PYE8_9ACTN|nr:hypothetical protein [Yinghuangia soli]MCF2528145.1 hypothetical protein [Yinghuangia soli]